MSDLPYAVHQRDGDLMATCVYGVDAVTLAAGHGIGATVHHKGRLVFTVAKESMTLMECCDAAKVVHSLKRGAVAPS